MFKISKLFRFKRRYRRYQLWIINTSVESRLYLWDNWRLLLPYLNRLVLLTNEQAFIRTSQFYQHENKWLGFGRMKWNEKNNIKWTTKYRENNIKESKLKFNSTQIWAPDWNQVGNTGLPPDVFIHLYNTSIPAILEGLIIALPVYLFKENDTLINDVLSELVQIIPNANVYITKRDWWGRVAESNNLEDMNPNEIMNIITSNSPLSIHHPRL